MPEATRVRVQQNGTIPATCPVCGTERQVHSDRIESGRHPIKVRCSCGNSFSVFAEFRRAHRREVNLPGTYAKPFSENHRGRILIKNISMIGVGFTMVEDHSLSPGDELTLRFTLDDDKQTEIEAVAVVMHIRDNFVGCGFQGLSPSQEDAMASYLMLIP